ncbi:MAG TPA: glycosyltransferase [Rubricoccaceae bacterium]|nr:glycosyltransferase [Rubricoccaceae bacterium]
MISVIVPVYNGAHVLPKTVPAMLAQDEPAEWLFVDDGSTDDTAAVLAGLLAAGPAAPGATARVLTHPTNRGRAAARNTGVAAAHGDLLVFLDADVAPAPGYLAALRDVSGATGAPAAVGRLTFAEVDPRDPYHRYLASPLRGVRDRAAGAPVPWRHFLLCVAAVRADAFREAGPFDEGITYGEDLEYACRLARRHPDGLRYAPGAVAAMYDLGDLGTALAKMREFAGGNLPRMVRAHPEVAEQVGLHRVAPGAGLRGRLARLALSAPVARLVRRVLPALPPRLSDYAVRYLLAHTLVSAYHEAAPSP